MATPIKAEDALTTDVLDQLVKLIKRAPAGGIFNDAEIVKVIPDYYESNARTFFVRLTPDTEFFQITVKR